MTEEQLNKQTERPKASAANSSENKRRRLIKSAVAIPVIMTLHSGAALARSSNIVGAVTNTADAFKVPSSTSANKENIVCIKGASDVGNNQFDLGDPVGAYPEIQLNEGGQDTLKLADQAQQCQDGGGFMLSAVAWESVGPKVGGIT